MNKERYVQHCCKLSVCLFKALIDEDRLLSRLEVMGSQLQAYSKVTHRHTLMLRCQIISRLE